MRLRCAVFLKAFDEKNAVQRFQNAAGDLDELKKLSRLRMRLIQIAMWLAIFGTVLTISVAEICRFGYIPTEEEIQVCPGQTCSSRSSSSDLSCPSKDEQGAT